MVLVEHALDGAQGVLVGHRHGVGRLSAAKALVVLLGVRGEEVDPLLAGLDLVGGQAVHELPHDGLDVTEERAVDVAGVAELGTVDVDLDELDVGVVLLAPTVAEHPVEAAADEQDDVGRAQGEAAAGGGGVGVVVGDEALGHGHGLEGDVRLVDELGDLLLGAGVGGALAHDDHGVLGVLEQRQGLLDHSLVGGLRRVQVLGREQDLLGGVLIHGLAHEVVRHVHIHAAGTAGGGGADGALDTQGMSSMRSMRNESLAKGTA